ncbi:hydroxymethylbilane synthase [Microbispora amethystogenes]|uniref:Hydroxymethylbilane synthase n=1 Tax=Microbispora amethystogenes TaxID=1427754 RepID=A0ABQ4FMK4_9ACTN|nr:hydroxymethylbilane synthase [Microbispora amethystogenes]GIH36008.1 porphobilinogen deaminase 2 [Microbispora amethystogenes]
MTDALPDILLSRFAAGPLRIGTRTSALARVQAENVAALIGKHAPGIETEIAPTQVSADLWPGDLAEVGGKGAFSKEIDRALVSGQIDIAVHCMKDVPGDVPLAEGTAFGAYLPRDDVHDVVITRDGTPLAGLPPGSLIGTSSVRRRAQLTMYRPGLRTERVRGNIDTRLDKLLEDGSHYAALVLARAGLVRLGILDRYHHEVLPVEFHSCDTGVVSMVPAVGAGTIGVQARHADGPVMRLLGELNDAVTTRYILAERTMLHMLRGHCNSPIAGYAARTADGRLSLFGMVFNRDGSELVRSHAWGDLDDAAALGSRVAADLLHQGAHRLISATRE